MTALYCLRDREGPPIARMYMREVPRVTSRILTKFRVKLNQDDIDPLNVGFTVS